MRKFILSLVIMMMTVFTVNAQTATENAKLFDNVYAGVEMGVATPMSFNSMFPLNTVAGLKLGKELTPVVGVEVEGQVFFNDNNFYRWTNTFVKGTNVSFNGTLNFSNLLFGYEGTPRVFEVKTNTGLGWLHYWGHNGNALTAKTALDLCFNFGEARAHTITVSPGVYWNMNETGKIQFNKSFAQLGLFVGYTYHFKTSNGTHHFVTYDVGAMNDEINRLKDELAKKPKEVTKEVLKVVDNDIIHTVSSDNYVFFSKNSADLTDDAKKILDNVSGVVEVTATASPEGTAAYNLNLSEKRAQVVADYLIKRGVKVTKVTGLGVTGQDSNRVAIVKVK